MFGRAILCAIGGLIAWILTEPLMPKNPMSEAWARAEFRMVFVVLASIGLMAGLHQGLMRGGRVAIGFGAALGLVFGLIGGFLGYQIGGVLAASFFGPNWLTSAFVVPARALVFALVGVGLGTGIGLTQFRTRIVLAGAFGGLLGGLICGLTFDLIGSVVAPLVMATSPGESVEVGAPGRAIFWTVLGISIGLFTALLENATRQAWIRLVLGRNEGKEWPIDAARTMIGRDERAHVPLFGDPQVMPLHASIVRQGPNYILQDEGSPIGTGYQGVRMGAPVALQPGDMFQVGSHQLQFLVKAGVAQKIREGRQHAVPVGLSGSTAPIQPVVVGPIANGVSTWSLVALDGPITGQRFPVNQPLEVGREAAGLSLAFDPQSSRRHAELTPGPGGIHVRDLGSTNGTFVDGQRNSEALAGPGSVIKIGSTSFRVELQ